LFFTLKGVAVLTRVADPVPFWPLNPVFGMGKKSRSGSGMNIPDHISESLEIIFWVKILKFFDADPGSGIFLTLDPGPGIEKNLDPGSTTMVQTFKTTRYDL
jgi:hypothetical protein